MLVITLRDLVGLFVFGWIAGFFSVFGLYIWFDRKAQKKVEDTNDA